MLLKNFFKRQKLSSKKLIFIAFLINLSCSLVHSAQVIDKVESVYLHTGLQVDYKLPESFRKETIKFEGNYLRYTAAKYKKSSNEIHFRPKRVGSGVLIIKNKKNKIIARLNIDVQKTNLHKIVSEVRDLLVLVDGITVKIYNKRVIVDGQVLLPKDMARIKIVINQYSPFVQSLVTYSPEAQKRVSEIVEQEIARPEVTVRYAYNRFLLEGCVSNADEKARAMGIANLYIQFEVAAVTKESRRSVNIINDQIKVPCLSDKKKKESKKISEIKKLIQIVVHFVEMEKHFNKGYLFQWSPGIAQGSQVTASAGTSAGAPTGITGVLTATINNFFPKLNWAKSFSFVRILHNSSILVEEEQMGTISISTGIPQTTINSDGGSITSQSTQAEVTTNVTPSVIGKRKDLIRLQIEIAVTSPGGGGSTSRKIRTSIHVKDGRSAVIGGLISTILTRDYNKVPVPSGALLNLTSAKSYDTSKSQFVVFVTPIIKSSSSLDVERIKSKFRLDE